MIGRAARAALLVLTSLALVPQHGAAEGGGGKDRSPASLALSPDGRWAVTANATADTASLVDLDKGEVAAEVPVGKRPFAVALSRDGKRAVVTNWMSRSVSVLEVAPPALRTIGTVEVGYEPRGVAISPDGSRAFVALSGDDAVSVVDLGGLAVVASAAVGQEPWHLVLTPDGKRLAVGHARSMDVRVLDAADLSLRHTVPLRGHNVRQLAVAPDGAWAYVGNVAERGGRTNREDIDRGWVLGSRLSRVPLGEEGPREAIALDPRGKAVADVDGVAVSPDGQLLALCAGGTHELILLLQPLPFVAFGGPGDHIDRDLVADARRFRRVQLGGRPVSAAFVPGGESVVVANYLANTLQVVSVASAQVTRTISLGGPESPSLARRGEAIFYDGKRSFHQWYSCHSCHTDGHTNGSSFDTLNDGRYGNAKKTLSLRGVSKTPPYTWHGWQQELRPAIEHSLTKTMQGPEPTAEDVDAVVAFLETIDFVPPRPPSSPDAVRRGQEIFRTRSCSRCHARPDYTTPRVYTVGLESRDDVYQGFNPPTLRGVRHRAPFLHDGRARSLEDVFAKRYHPPLSEGEEDMTREEIADLVAFLESL
ncbi:c-type cytochrome [bacterium]|nr:c-type cytochrome [bacterium]